MDAAEARAEARRHEGSVRGKLFSRLAWLGLAAAPPILRIALALPFLRSGLTKWDGLALSPSVIHLFEHEFRLHILGAAYAFPAPAFAAFFAASAEIVLPVLLLLGFATRLAAFGILLMTAVIQLVVPDGWFSHHLSWAAMALALMALGPGPVSFDRLIAKHR